MIPHHTENKSDVHMLASCRACGPAMQDGSGHQTQAEACGDAAGRGVKQSAPLRPLHVHQDLLPLRQLLSR